MKLPERVFSCRGISWLRLLFFDRGWELGNQEVQIKSTC